MRVHLRPESAAVLAAISALCQLAAQAGAQTLPGPEQVMAQTGSCVDEPGACRFELRDLNGDGSAELLITADSDGLYVFGAVGTSWAALGSMPLYAASTWTVLESRSDGFADLQLRVNEVGCWEDTIYRWNAGAYAVSERRNGEDVPGACAALSGDVAAAPEEGIRGLLIDRATAAGPDGNGAQRAPAADWYLLGEPHGLLALDPGAVAPQLGALNGQAVALTGSLADGRLRVDTAAAIPGGLTFDVEGVLNEPQTGYDSRALDWHVVTDAGEAVELNELPDMDPYALIGQRVRAAGFLTVGNRFYEDAGYEVSIHRVVVSLAAAPGGTTTPPEPPPAAGSLPASLAAEHIAGLAPGTPGDDVRRLLGDPAGVEVESELEGATGCRVEAWHYPLQGLDVTVCASTDTGAVFVRAIRAEAPWGGAMPCGLRIGADEATARALLGGDVHMRDLEAWRGIRVDVAGGLVSVISLYELGE